MFKFSRTVGRDVAIQYQDERDDRDQVGEDQGHCDESGRRVVSRRSYG